MVLENVLKLLEEKFFAASVMDDLLFNQYNDQNPEVDLPEAAEIRRKNLGNYLRSFPKLPYTVIVGEAPGWRGCRFSGVPFTSEFQLCNNYLPFSGNRSSKSCSPYKENSATIFWRYMRRHHPDFFIWNCIPFHPHKSSNPLSNRTPSKREIFAYLPFLSEMLSLMKPGQVVALGKTAKLALERINIPFTYVRHPAQGGANEFIAGMERIFNTGSDLYF